MFTFLFILAIIAGAILLIGRLLFLLSEGQFRPYYLKYEDSRYVICHYKLFKMFSKHYLSADLKLVKTPRTNCYFRTQEQAQLILDKYLDDNNIL